MKHILISRVDNMGDVILTLPMAGILKQHFPDCKITLLARDYVRAIAENGEYIDAVESWDVLSRMPASDAVTQIKKLNIDVVIHAFPKKQIAKLMIKANIPLRIGTSRRWYHWLTCNKKVNFSRAKSNEHEAQLNLKLLRPLFILINPDLKRMQNFMGLKKSPFLPPRLKEPFIPNRFRLIIHPFTNGNTREWPVAQWIALIQSLPLDRIQIFLTGSQKENQMIKEKILPHCTAVTNFASQCNLNELIQLISHCDGLIANSTGPLHLAAALGIHALGLFPVTKGMDIKRWAPIGEKAEVITADPHCQNPLCMKKNDCICMQSITVDAVKNTVLNWLSRRSSHQPTAH